MAYALIVDDPDGFVNRAEVRAELDKALAGVTQLPLSREDQIRAWSTSPEAKRGQDAALALAGRR